MNIIIYSNCQFDGIIPNLKLNLKNINIFTLENYSFIRKQIPLPIKKLNECDIFIYQPIRKEHGIYSTTPDINNSIMSYLPSTCLKISFPYIYNSGIWGLTKDAIANDDGSKQGNRDVIELLKDNSLDKIIKMYNNNEINFNYKQRFESSLNKLKQREKLCDIHISQFIVDNIQKHKLFFTQNHPTPFIFTHICQQILDIIKIKFQDNIIQSNYKFANYNSLCRGESWPISKSDISYWKFDYIKLPDKNVDEYYIDLITKYYNNVRRHNEGIPDVYY